MMIIHPSSVNRRLRLIRVMGVVEPVPTVIGQEAVRHRALESINPTITIHTPIPHK